MEPPPLRSLPVRGGHDGSQILTSMAITTSNPAKTLPDMDSPLPTPPPTLVKRHSSPYVQRAWLLANRLYKEFSPPYTRKELNHTKRRIAPLLLFCLHFIDFHAQNALRDPGKSSSFTTAEDPDSSQGISMERGQVVAGWQEIRQIVGSRISRWTKSSGEKSGLDINNTGTVCALLVENRQQRPTEDKFWWLLLAYDYAEVVFKEVSMRDEWTGGQRHLTLLSNEGGYTLGKAWEYVQEVYNLLYAYVVELENNGPRLVSKLKLEGRLRGIRRTISKYEPVEGA